MSENLESFDEAIVTGPVCVGDGLLSYEHEEMIQPRDLTQELANAHSAYSDRSLSDGSLELTL